MIENEKIPISYKDDSGKEIQFEDVIACRLRNPGYVCFPNEDDSYSAYKPSEICDLKNYELYVNDTYLKTRFFHTNYYLLILFSLLSVLILPFVFNYKDGQMYEKMIVTFYIAVFIFILLYFFTSNRNKKKVIYDLSNLKRNKYIVDCIQDVYLYGSVYSEDKPSNLNKKTFIVDDYSIPNELDESVMIYYDLWKNDIINDNSIRIFKELRNAKMSNIL